MRAVSILPAGAWNISEAIDSVLLDFDMRHRRRITLRTEAGAELLLDLAQAARLRDGDAMVLDTAALVRVRARPEALLEIHAHDESALIRIAWHLGNRHLPVQVLGDRLRIRDDHVIAALVGQLGGHAARIEAPFDPEAGAYEHGH
ncbi:MAG: urease accessory protein UreE [Acetobacteraceae bacterium]